MADEPFYKDLKLTNRSFGAQVSGRDGVDLLATLQRDLHTIDGRANLAQAVINRLLTRQGELARLGHPQYGSRLYQLVGEPNSIRMRGLAELYIREALDRESRIEEITEIAFAPIDRRQGRHELKVRIRVRPVDETEELTITLPINL